jgi:hypothetical protein
MIPSSVTPKWSNAWAMAAFADLGFSEAWKFKAKKEAWAEVMGEANPPPFLFFFAFIHRSAWNRNSANFATASNDEVTPRIRTLGDAPGSRYLLGWWR